MEVVKPSASQEGLNGSAPKDLENQAFPSMPLGFQGMLKTSTETGDIGRFTIVPPRVPHHPAALPMAKSPRRRVRSNAVKHSPEWFPERYPNFHPMNDDRRRLPSYSLVPGAASDTVSLFDTASQRSTPSSSRPFKDAEYRASSMTASSYTPFGISSNHHSYTSLRSQPEPITQRPRSPYLYPTRLKRPGFRPSSPLLLEAGVDYSRRAEIERPLAPPIAPYMMNGRSASPSSFHGHRRVQPPLSIRTDINRSNPSPRKPQTPARNQNWQHPASVYEDPSRDWSRRKDANCHRDVSPARSNCSYASTVNLYRSYPPGSTVTTPARAPPPSPLYYDYTEDFHTEEFSEPTRDDAPPFHLEKTIHEDRPLSSGWDSLETLEVRGAQPRFNSANSIRSSAGELIVDFAAIEEETLPAIDHLPNGSDMPKPLRRHSDIIPDHGDSLENLVRMYENENANGESADEEAPARNFALRNQQTQQSISPMMAELPAEPVVSNASAELLAEFNDLMADNFTDRSSEYSLSSNLPRNFPKPPTPLPPLPLLVDKLKRNGSGSGFHLNKKLPIRPPDEYTFFPGIPDLTFRAATSVDHRVESDENKAKHRRSASTQSAHYRSSKCLSVDPALTDLAQLVSTFEAAKARGDFGWSINGHAQPIRKSTTCNDIQSGNDAQNQRNDQRTLKQHRSENNLSGQAHKLDRHGYQEPHKSSHAALQPTTNFSTPMYAPKPISPARVAKLKKTVPQLMKALPALPKHDSLRAISPPTVLPPVADDLPFRFSPLVNPTPEPAELDSSPVQRVVELPAESRQPPKLKLRLRRTEPAVAPTSSETSRPWNLEESYPWSAEPTTQTGSGAQNQKPGRAKVPRFKLKVSRPSVSSIETVQVNRNTAEVRESFGLENPRDLFTPPSRQHGIHALFSKVSRHFSNPKKTSTAGKSFSMENVASGEPRHNTGSSDRGSSLDLGIPQLPFPISTHEARSFFSDDSSQIQGGHSLRRKFTNLRARLPSPYNSRPATMVTQSYDDIVYRQRSIRAAARLGTGEFNVANGNITSDKVYSEGHRQRLKFKVSHWLGRAKNLILTGYTKPRSPKGQRSSEQ